MTKKQSEQLLPGAKGDKLLLSKEHKSVDEKATELSDSHASKRRKRDKEASKKALLEAAIEVFSEMGYEAATTREIAKRAKISEALIQRYFDGKSGLLAEVTGIWMTENEKHRIAPMPLADTLRADIEQLVRFSIAHHRERQDLIRVTLARATVDKVLGVQMSKMITDRDIPALVARLQHFQKIGQMKKTVDLTQVAHGILSTAFSLGFISSEVFHFDRTQMESAALMVAGFIADGLSEPK